MLNDANNAEEECLHVPFGRPLACEGVGKSSSQSWRLTRQVFSFWDETVPFWGETALFCSSADFEVSGPLKTAPFQGETAPFCSRGQVLAAALDSFSG